MVPPEQWDDMLTAWLERPMTGLDDLTTDDITTINAIFKEN